MARAKYAPLFLTALLLAACGQEPNQQQSSHGVHEGGTLALRLKAEELALRADSTCGLAPPHLLGAVTGSVKRFNQFVVEPGQAPLYAGHPGSKDGIAVLVCDDNQMGAFAYGATVAIHAGLLDALRHEANKRNDNDLFEAATAFVIYHELAHAELGHTLPSSVHGSLFGFGDPYLELQADAFAAASLKAAGYRLEGAGLVFSLLDSVNPEGDLTHLSSYERALRLDPL